MDLQDLFCSLTEGWLKWHLWLGTRQGVFTTWHVFNSRMRWHQAPHRIPAEFTAHLHKQAHMDSANLFDACVCSRYLDSDFLSGMRACVCVCVCVCVPPCGYATLVWHFSASVNKWPHPIMSFRSQMPSNKLLISHLFVHSLSLSPLKHLLPLSLTPALKALGTGWGEHIKGLHSLKWLWVISQWEAISHPSFSDIFAR